MGETETLFAKVGPDGASQEVTWSSSDSTVVTVSSSGLLTPAKVGTATITAKPKNSSKTATCSVEIVAQPEPETYVDVDLVWTDDEGTKAFYNELSGVEKGQNYKINFDLTDVDFVDKTTLSNLMILIATGDADSLTPIKLQSNHNFYLDDEVNDDFLYSFDPTGAFLDGACFWWANDQDVWPPLPETFDQTDSKCSLAISPFENVSETVHILAIVQYEGQP